MKMLLLESYGLKNILRIKWDQFMFVVVSIRQNLNFPIQMLVKNSLNLHISFRPFSRNGAFNAFYSSVLLSKGFFELKSLSHNLKKWTDKNVI